MPSRGKKKGARRFQNEDGHQFGNVLMHHGIKKQRWGVRRFQNEDGTLTAEGRERYDVGDPEEATKKKHPELDIVEEIELDNGEKLQYEPFGIYKYMKNSRDVGRYIDDDYTDFCLESARNMRKDKAMYEAMMNCHKEFVELSNKVKKMDFNHINFKKLNKIAKAIEKREHQIMTEYIRKYNVGV